MSLSPVAPFRVLCTCALLAVSLARAQLASVSPFVPPPGARNSTAPTTDAPLEFRGIAELPDGAAFRLVDPVRKTGVWLHLNERDPDLGVTVKQHDAARDTVTVEHQGRTLTLALRQSKVASSGAVMPNAAMTMPPMGPPTIANLAMQQQQQAPTPAVQQAQLDAVAAAVAQRRLLRDQATQQISQGVAVAPQVIQQQQQQRAQNAAQNPNAQNPNNAAAQKGAKRGRQ